jgi:hypothetical protein
MISTSRSTSSGASSSIMSPLSLRQGAEQLVQLSLGGRLLPTLRVLDHEDHD